MGMDLVTADEHLAPAVLVAAQEFASAAVAGGWYVLQFNPQPSTGRVIAMPPGPDRLGHLTRGGGDDLVEMAKSWLDKDPAIAWLPSSDAVGRTVRRCREADLPGPATALRVLTCHRAVQYRVELSLHPGVAGPVYSALFERTE